MSQEENRDEQNQNNEPVENDDKSPFRSGGLRSRRILDSSLGDISNNNPTHILFDKLNRSADSDTDKNSTTSERKAKQEKDVGNS